MTRQAAKAGAPRWYYHVEGKEDLLYAICKSSIEQLDNDVIEATEGISDPLAQLRAGMQTHVVSLLPDQTQHATSLAEARALSPERLAEIVSMRKAYQGACAIGPRSRTTGRVHTEGHLQQIPRHDAGRSTGSHGGLVQAEWRTQASATGCNMSDYVATVLMSRALPEIQHQVPGIAVEVPVPSNRSDRLDRGEADLTIGQHLFVEFVNVFNRTQFHLINLGNFSTLPTKFRSGANTGLYSGGFGLIVPTSGTSGMRSGRFIGRFTF